MVDLRPIHRLVSLLPQEVNETDLCIRDTIEALMAACFHAALPIRQACAEEWIKAHPEPVRPQGMDLLVKLGLVQTQQSYRRY